MNCPATYAAVPRAWGRWARVTLCDGQVTWAAGWLGRVRVRGMAATWDAAREALERLEGLRDG